VRATEHLDVYYEQPCVTYEECLKVRKLQETLSLTEAEYKEFEVKEDGVQTTWNTKGQEERELEIGEKASDIIAEALKKLNDEDKLTVQYMSVYEKFVEKK